MEFEYDPVADVLYIRIRKAKVAESEEVESGFIVDYDEDGNIVGVEVLYPRKRKIDMNKIIFDPASVLPVLI